MPVITVRNDLGLIARAVQLLTRNEVVIGVPADGPARTADPGEPDPPSNDVIAYLMETGAPDQNLPARPFLVPGVQSITAQAAARLRSAGKAALLGGGRAAVETALDQIGLIGQAAVRAQMTDGTFAPLAERTLAARRARGRTGTQPLIDTAQLRNAVTYAVRRKGG